MNSKTSCLFTYCWPSQSQSYYLRIEIDWKGIILGDSSGSCDHLSSLETQRRYSLRVNCISSKDNNWLIIP